MKGGFFNIKEKHAVSSSSPKQLSAELVRYQIVVTKRPAPNSPIPYGSCFTNRLLNSLWLKLLLLQDHKFVSFQQKSI